MKTFREEAKTRIKAKAYEIAKELKSKPCSDLREQRLNGQIEGLQLAVRILK